MRRTHLRRWIRLLGALNVACFAAYTVASYGLTPVAPFGASEPREAEVFRALAQRLSFLGPAVQAFVRGQSLLTQKAVFLLVYATPFFVSTGVFVGLLMVLARYEAEIDSTTPRLLFRWTVAFAAASVLASPVLVQDFWLSIAWGRMVAAGGNPYHAHLTPALIRGLPIDDDLRMRMTYGPLWALLSGLGMWLCQRWVVFEAALFKLLLAGAWIAMLWLIRVLLRHHSPRRQATALALAGWIPLSVTQTVADGHNDVVMLLLGLLWLYELDRERGLRADVALAASALIKYVSAPLFLLDFLHWRVARSRSLRSYAVQMAPAVVFMGVVVGLFYRSADFFSETAQMARWRFLAPSDGIFQVGKWLSAMWGAPWIRIPFLALGIAVWALFPLLAVYFTVRYVAQPDHEKLWHAVLAVFAALLFSVVGHVWPWFILWALAVAALVPEVGLTRWIVGVALMAPFAILILFVFPGPDRYFIPTLMLNVPAALWFAFAPRTWFAKGSAARRR